MTDTAVAVAAPPPAKDAPTGLLPILRAALLELHEAALGEAGAQIRTLGHRAGQVATIVRTLLRGIVELLSALARGFTIAEGLVRGVDAALALVEILLDSVGALIDSVGGFVAYIKDQRAGEAPSGGDLTIFDQLRSPLDEARKFLSDSGVVAERMPSVAEIAGVRQALGLLVGSAADPRITAVGSLIALTEAIAPMPAGAATPSLSPPSATPTSSSTSSSANNIAAGAPAPTAAEGGLTTRP